MRLAYFLNRTTITGEQQLSCPFKAWLCGMVSLHYDVTCGCFAKGMTGQVCSSVATCHKWRGAYDAAQELQMGQDMAILGIRYVI